MVTGFGLVRARLTQKDIERFERRAEEADGRLPRRRPRRRDPELADGRHLGHGGRRCVGRAAPSGRTRDFMKMWTGQTISEFGSSVSQLALPIIAILDAARVRLRGRRPRHRRVPALPPLHAAGRRVGRPTAAPLGPDRRRRRSRSPAPVRCRSPTCSGHLDLAQLFVVGFIDGILTVFFDVAYQSYLPALVDREYLIEGNSKLEVTRSAGQLAGPAAGGRLIAAPDRAVRGRLGLGELLRLGRIPARDPQAEEPPLEKTRGRPPRRHATRALGGSALRRQAPATSGRRRSRRALQLLLERRVLDPASCSRSGLCTCRMGLIGVVFAARQHWLAHRALRPRRACSDGSASAARRSSARR